MSSRTSSSQTRRRHSANPSMEGYPAAQPRCQVVLEGLSRFLPFKGKRRTYQRIAGDGEFSALSGQQLRHQPPWCMERIRPARAAWAVLAQVPARSAEGNAQHGRLNRKGRTCATSNAHQVSAAETEQHFQEWREQVLQSSTRMDDLTCYPLCLRGGQKSNQPSGVFGHPNAPHW